VWLTSLKRPLVVIHELFTHSVLDASWSPCGLRLAACSWDGTAVFIEFTQQELGQPLDPAEQVIIMRVCVHIHARTHKHNTIIIFIYFTELIILLYLYRVAYMNDCMVNHWFKEVVW